MSTLCSIVSNNFSCKSALGYLIFYALSLLQTFPLKLNPSRLIGAKGRVREVWGYLLLAALFTAAIQMSTHIYIRRLLWSFMFSIFVGFALISSGWSRFFSIGDSSPFLNPVSKKPIVILPLILAAGPAYEFNLILCVWPYG